MNFILEKKKKKKTEAPSFTLHLGTCSSLLTNGLKRLLIHKKNPEFHFSHTF